MGDSPVASEENKRMEHLLMKCPMCDVIYSEDNVPRNLTCGHSLCTVCASTCLTSQKSCPECNEKQFATEASDLPVNYPLLRLMQTVTDEKLDFKDITLPAFPFGIYNVESCQDAEKCPLHDSPMILMCISCSMWICHDCSVLDHAYPPRGSCRITSITEAMGLIKKEFHKEVDLTLRDVEDIKRNLEPEMLRLSFCLKHCELDIRSHSRLNGIINQELETLKKVDAATVEEAIKFVEQSQKTVSIATSSQEMTTSCNMLLDCQTNLKEYIAQEKERKRSLKQNISVHLRMDLKLLVDGKKPVYAVFEEERRTRWALVTLRDDRLLLYSLKDGRPPKEGINIPFEFVRELIPKEDATVFFEVGTTDAAQGLVQVKLNRDTTRTRRIILLCSGEEGTCYRKTCFHEYDHKDGILRGGHLQNHNSPGNHTMFAAIEDFDVDCVCENMAGVFAGDESSYANFNFYLQNIDNNHANYVVGKVTRGLHVLKAASKLQPITDSIIWDCGLIIPMHINDDNLMEVT